MARLPLWLRAALWAAPALLLILLLALIAAGRWAKRQVLDSGGPLRPAMAAYDVRHYGLEVEVDPVARRVEGSSRVTVVARDALDVVELHLDDRLTVASVEVDGAAVDFDHDDGVVTAELATAWRPGERHDVAVAYGGRPKRALKAPWIDGFVWEESADGSPWVGVTVEVDGCDVWWPCKDHPSDEPDEGMDIALTVPAGLIGLSNGRPLGETVAPDGAVTTRWRVGFPINGYGVTVNIGPYVPVEAVYHGVDGERAETIVLWSLPEAADRARRLWEGAPHVLEVLARRFGEVPFLDDKLWVAHAPYLGMEHQTLVAYGGDFAEGDHGVDELLLHELAHEWWGNKVTAADWADLWLHEGFASYAEALFVLDTRGEDAYLEAMQGLRSRMANRLPVVQGADLTAAAAYTPDIYGKGAWVLHMLRLLLGDDALGEILWRFADGDHPTACRFVATADLIRLVEEVAGRDLGWFWQRYLRTAELPRWSVQRSSSGAADRVEIRWDDPGFEMPLPVAVDGERRLVEMPGGRAELTVARSAEVVVDPRREVLAQPR
jgi:aminopeptidase N